MSISGYASSMSVAPGGRIGFYLSSDTPGATTFTIQRVGTGSAPTKNVAASVANQPVPAASPWEGYGWTQTFRFTVPAAWPTGLYSLFEAGGDPGSPILRFVVLPSSPGSGSTILLRIAFLMEQAYNSSGGKSLYGFNSLPNYDESSRASQVSFDRPGAVPSREVPLIQWLEAEGIPVEYCACIDLHTNPSLLSSYDCFVSAGHDRSWTKEMRDHVEIFLANGGNLIVLSGNTCYRQVRLEQGNRMVVFYKYAGHDPNGDNEYATVAFAEPPLNRPPNSLIGAGFTFGAFSGGPDPYTIRFPSHWVFGGIQFPANQPPQTNAFMGYETDAAPFVDEPEGYPRVTGEEGTPLSYVVLASADLRSWGGKPGMATMGLLLRNGTVFNGGSTEWISNLDPATGDPVLRQVTRNVFQRLKTTLVWDWENIGHANSGKALTAVDNKLFIATSQNLLWRRYPVGAEVAWTQIGHANNVIAMAATQDTLFCVTADNTLWWRPPVETNVNWTAAGSGPTGGTKALAGIAGMLYAVDVNGQMWRGAAVKTGAVAWAGFGWTAVDATVNAMCADADILFASTTDNRLLRSDHDWIAESNGWAQIHHCNFSVGLAVIDKMLFVATSQNRLWRLDLHGLRQP